ncbi:hypothetical protein AB0A71_30840 [Kitasatospora aureofaciens]
MVTSAVEIAARSGGGPVTDDGLAADQARAIADRGVEMIRA